MTAAITSLGAVTAHGLGAPRLFAALLEGRSAVGRVTRFDTAGLCSELGAEAPGDDALVAAPERCTRLLLIAAAEAFEARGVAPSRRRGVVVGTTKGALERSVRAWTAGEVPSGDPLAEPAYALAAATRSEGPVVTVCGACASSAIAIGQALSWIEDGRCDEVVVGGVEALHPFVYSGFHALKALSPRPAAPFDANRSGLSLGEGSGVLVLASEAWAKASGLPSLARVDGFGMACDGNDQTAPDPSGRGLLRACRAALKRAGCDASAIGAYVAHGTATAQNDRMEAAAYATLFGGAEVPVCAFKGSIGHTLGGAGAIDSAAAALALGHRLLPPVANLVTPDPALPVHPVCGAPARLERERLLVASAGFGGINAALVLRAA